MQVVTAFVGPEDPDGFMRVVRAGGRGVRDARASSEEKSGGGTGGERVRDGDPQGDDDSDEKVLLMGLHTCGDLAPSLLRFAKKEPNMTQNEPYIYLQKRPTRAFDALRCGESISCLASTWCLKG